METPNVPTDQSLTQIIHPPGPGRFSFFRAPAQSVKPLKSADVKGIYKYITLYQPAMKATQELRDITDEKEARKLQAKIAKNKFDYNDFLGQIQQIKKMGNIKDLAAMIPGVGKAIKDVDIDDNAFKGIEAIINSMTPKERSHPEIINQSRRTRIAKGSGTNIQDVNRLMKQFDQMRKMMKMVTGMNNSKMMQMAAAMKQKMK